MTTTHFINTRIKAGIWHGDLIGAGKDPSALQVTHQGDALAQVDCTHDAIQDVWHVTVPIPSALIADGVQTFLISDQSGTILESFTLIAGAPLAEDLRAEISLMRGELEMLKKAFRQHCADN
ncbi:hypothetical protein [Yoonia algicola]|uniref:Uncharacterized protein n=1 Tax=Yoonia algicola TaxID=3137368 RepID=A0AAN0M430_9RHOB